MGPPEEGGAMEMILYPRYVVSLGFRQTGFILGQISGCNEAAIFLHILDNEFGCFARIEISRVIGNAAQDFSQVLLDKDFSFLIETAVLVGEK